MGTTWGDLRTWGQLDLWWIPNATQAAASVTSAGAGSAGGNDVSGASSGSMNAESLAAASRIAASHANGVVDLFATASVAVVSSVDAATAAAAEFGASASAVRIPPRDRPAGHLSARLVRR